MAMAIHRETELLRLLLAPLLRRRGHCPICSRSSLRGGAPVIKGSGPKPLPSTLVSGRYDQKMDAVSFFAFEENVHAFSKCD